MRHALAGHRVETAFERGWSTLKNGELIAAAEAAAFDVFVTTDKNLKYQQDLFGRSLTIVVLQTTSWPRLQKVIPRIVAAVTTAGRGDYVEVPAE